MKFDSNHRLVFNIEDVKHPIHRAMLREEAKVIVGYERELLFLNLLFSADGHALLMANSGLGKTMIGTCLPQVISGLKGARVQGTPDLMPSTVVGYSVITAAGDTIWNQGQVPGGDDGANFLLVDEATRLTPRLWAAFLQMLEERRKTVENITFDMPDVFTSVLTANFPAPGQGTVELPDAAYDRLMFNIQWGYPTLEGLKEIARRTAALRERRAEAIIEPVTDLNGIRKMRAEVKAISGDVPEQVIDYIGRLTYATNPHLTHIEAFKTKEGKPFKDFVAAGGSPRCAMDMVAAAAALAHAFGDERVRPEHVKAVFPDVARAHTKMGDLANLGRNKVRIDDLITAILQGTQP